MGYKKGRFLGEMFFARALRVRAYNTYGYVRKGIGCIRVGDCGGKWRSGMLGRMGEIYRLKI